jgi:peptidoglycan/LPS O-acetylase OafA/YrhL
MFSGERIHGLDGLRGVASILVVMYHFGPHILRGESGSVAFLQRISGALFSGVDLFFVLSGFLIGGILIDHKPSANYYKTFYGRRICRILPLYYLVLLSYVVALLVLGQAASGLGKLFESPLPAVSYWTFTQNFAMSFRNSFGPIWLAGTWSLAVEEQFYLILPAVVRRLSLNVLTVCSAVCVALAPFIRLLIYYYKLPGMSAYVLLIARCDSLALGVLVAIAIRQRPEWFAKYRCRLPWLAGVFGLLAVIHMYRPHPYFVKFAFADHSLLGLYYACLLCSVLAGPGMAHSRFFSTSAMRALGDMAYCTYLIHPILLCLAFRLLTGVDPAWSGIASALPVTIALIATLVIAKLSWQFFEKPILRLGHQFNY